MTIAAFDTYAAAKTLRAAGFNESQAEAAVAVIRDAVVESAATKADLQAGLAEARTGHAADLQAALARADLATNKSMEAAIEKVKAELTWRMVLAFLGFATVVIGAIKLIP